MAATGSWTGSSSGVLPINPTEGECCLSFSDEKGASRSLVVNRMLLNPYSAKIINDKQDLPPRVTEMPKLKPSDPPVTDNGTVTITFYLEGQTAARQRTSTTVCGELHDMQL
ncbi:hypothetical protein E2C01_060937 [Portunus trituberculatus]|uniref:Uncharacterized protein n=1 Tax=Portunus trituberculatus TaxID=210409 RepID=A0A5B7HDQ1_PORTR|nr:hypothetical protein [Portunus trituberculatus]